MSNHDGSYMLNEVLVLLDKYSVFDWLGKEKAKQFVDDVIYISRGHDCNMGEVLEGIGEKFDLCYECCRPTTEFVDGICRECDKHRITWEGDPAPFIEAISRFVNR